MGIPAFYRWLVERYQLAVVDVVEETPVVVDGVAVAIDTTRPNPNGVEFDNLYLDMNGIVHPCFHPEGLPPPKTYEEVFRAIFKYIDRIFSIVRPRKLLYMAIDGVAPRAKMNQQRTRRFRSAKDALDSASEIQRASGLHEVKGEDFTLLEQTNKLDSNVITPGTEFMALLSSALRYYVHLRMNVDLGWQGLKVILSDASVPGEGEHKIMSYIRLQRNLPGFNPNTRHCLYGLDADLILLALATHEIHFSILREDIRKAPRNFGKRNHRKDYLQRRKLQQETPSDMNLEDYISSQKFQFLNTWVLRDYLANDLRLPGLKADSERLIDDFVFMCIFIGNDFLPHVPSLEVSEGAINLLMVVYKKEFVRIGGYLTNSFEVNFDRLERFLQAVGSHESAIFRKRSQVQKEQEFRLRGVSSNSRFKKALSSVKPVSENANFVVDKVKLGEKGWKERFYAEKFEVKTDDDREKVRRHAVLKYVEGISWVMHYYYQGVCSWQWFYPYHYAPFASDFYGLDQLEIQFTLGKPFKPFDQLMGVLPAASAHALPLFYRKLMTDSSSPIFEFYPTDFELDMNGKRFAWQAICKLPFICESCLLSEIAKVEHTLTDEEKQRNSLGLDVLFIHISHPLAVKIFCFRNRKDGHPKLCKAKVKRKINPHVSGGMNGYIYISDKPVCPGEIYSPIDGMEMLTKSEVMSVFYKYPSFHSHIPQPPKGVIMPTKSVNKQYILRPPVLWHERSSIFGRMCSERPVPRSVSGPWLARYSHGLVSQYYLAKQQESRRWIKTQDHVGGDGLACRSNLKPTDFLVVVNGASDCCNLGKTRRKKRGRKIPKQQAEVLACQSNLKAGKKESMGCKDVMDHMVVDNLGCQSKSKENSVLCNEVETAKQQQSVGHLEVLDHAGEDDLASKLNSKRTDCKVDWVGGDDLAVQLNLKPTDHVTQLNGSSEGCTVNEPSKGKLRKRKRRSKGSGGQHNNIELAKQQESTGFLEVSDSQQERMGCAEVLDCGAVDGSISKLKSGSHDTIEVAKERESLGCIEAVEPVRTGDFAFQLNLKQTDCVMQGNLGSQSCNISEPRKRKLRKKKRRKGNSGSHNNINVQEQQPSTGSEVMECVGVHDLASESNSKVISGSYDGLKMAKQQQSMKNIEVVEHVGVDAFASNLKPTDCLMQANGGCESCIASEPKKKKPQKKRAKKGNRNKRNKIEASKQQESMGLLEVVDPVSVDCLTHQSEPKQADCVIEVNRGSEVSIDNGHRKRKQSNEQGGTVKEIKRQKGCDEK